MWRTGLIIVVVAAISLGIGWWLREQRAIDSCLHAGGQWERDGYCVGAIYGSMIE